MQDWKSYERSAEKGPLSLGVKIFFGIFILSALVSTVTFFMNPFKQAARVINKTIDADNMIQNYEWFKQRHQSIKAIDRKIVDAAAVVASFSESAGDRQGWHREDREEYARLSSIHMGLKQQRADLVAEYNAKSRMANRSIFKAGDVELPESISQE